MSLYPSNVMHENQEKEILDTPEAVPTFNSLSYIVCCIGVA
jgi:hypothetical protein